MNEISRDAAPYTITSLHDDGRPVTDSNTSAGFERVVGFFE
jgi:hypothetical protein